MTERPRDAMTKGDVELSEASVGAYFGKFRRVKIGSKRLISSVDFGIDRQAQTCIVWPTSDGVYLIYRDLIRTAMQIPRSEGQNLVPIREFCGIDFPLSMAAGAYETPNVKAS